MMFDSPWELGHWCYQCKRLFFHVDIEQTFLTVIGKQQALSREVTCYFRLYLEIGRICVQTSEKH